MSPEEIELNETRIKYLQAQINYMFAAIVIGFVIITLLGLGVLVVALG